jgi:hypothetical protein
MNESLATGWPTDAYQSVRFLLGFFLMPDSLPFREWKKTSVDLSPAMERTVKIAVRALQTRLYFEMLKERFSAAEAEIARDCFIQLLSDLDEDRETGGGNIMRYMLQLIDDAAKSAAKAGTKRIPTPDGDVETPLEYSMALFLMVSIPVSPYYDSKRLTHLGMEDLEFTRCLIHGKEWAIEFFTPMIDAITSFDVTRFPRWTWRSKPGAHERHLQRRHNNLLFPGPRRVVTTSEVLEARRKDDAEFRQLAINAKSIELPKHLPIDWQGFLSNIRERIDLLKKRAKQIGGDTTQIMDLLQSLRDAMANVSREQMRGNVEALSLFERAEAMAKEQDKIFRLDFINQVLRKDDCIPREELVPALLCEDAATVAAFCELTGEAQRKDAQLWAAQITKEAEKEGFDIMSIKEQLYALGWPRPSA